MAAVRDIVIIGAGHNGLVTAYYLARAGHRPIVLERRPIVGGVATTEEFAPGFKVSTLVHSSGPLLPAIVKDMRLERLGLQMIAPDPRVFAPSPDGRALVLYGESARSAAAIAKFSKKDAAQYVEFQRILGRAGKFLSRLPTLTPPALAKPSVSDIWGLLKLGKSFRSLGRKDMQRLLRWGPMAVADFVGEWFETELLRATIAARGIFATAMGPWSAGSTAVLLLRAAADPHPVGATLFARGGMGALTEALAAAAKKVGAEIRTSADVAQILVKDGAVTGVVLSTGEEIPAKTVISNADPRRTFLRLIDPVHFAPDFLVKMQHYRCQGHVAKVNLALMGVPAFKSLGRETTAALAGRILIGPEIDYLERAFDHSKYGEFSRQPHLEITIPSISDPTLAPIGKQVMSIYVQFIPFCFQNKDSASQRDALGDAVVKTIAAYAWNLPGLIEARQVLMPQDLEDIYNLTGGHIFHGEPALDQLFTMRPLLGWARYRAPLQGLYLCGSGTHPGTSLNGASGYNASREILKDLRR